MGTILTTPLSQDQNSENVNFGKEKNNNSTNAGYYSSKGNLPFSKLNFMHDCLPSLSGKENRFFNEKVPSYILKSKGDSKKKNKTKIVPEQYNRIDSNAKARLNVSEPVLAAEVTSEKISRPRHESRGVENLKLSLSQPDLHKQCSTFTLSETLKYIGCFVYLRCRHIEGLKPSVVVSWIRGVDRSLILSGWQEQGFLSQPNMIVLFMLLRETINSDISSLIKLKATMMSSLYMCYAYNGHEISYPLKPFLVDGDRAGFWDRSMYIINHHSAKMLLINKDSKYYNEVQSELKLFGRSLERKDG